MEEALSILLRQPIEVMGAGRTDTGVHASSYVAHFNLDNEATQRTNSGTEKQAPPAPEDPQFLFRLNRFLPRDITVFRIFPVDTSLHARFSARSRTYHYYISTQKPLYKRNYAHYVYGELDTEAIDSCCRVLQETRDFTSFAKVNSDVKTHICHVQHAAWVQVEGGYRFEISSDRFLRNMVRSIVGTLLDVGQGKCTVEEFSKIVEARNRSRAGQSAQARGLFLAGITYKGLAPFTAPIEAGP
jgi:tRNA pseudouridine38-40 synthase